MSLDDLQDEIEYLQFKAKAADANFDLLYKAIVETCEMDTVLAIHYRHLELIRKMDPTPYLKK